jgi:hypothetical protein
VIEKDAFAELRRWVDAGVEDFGGAALKVESRIFLSVPPQPMREPVSLDRREAFKKEARLQNSIAGRFLFPCGWRVSQRAFHRADVSTPSDVMAKTNRRQFWQFSVVASFALAAAAGLAA